MTQTLSQLENRDAFIERHIGPDAQQQQEMLKTVGADSLNALIGQIVPQDIQLATPPQVGDATTEFAALAELKAIASRNKRFKSYIGMGYTAVQLPPVIQRNMLENPGWYTAYTPYQPEVSQGRLESLLNFQQVTLDLTGLDIASASLLDEATAAAEAMAMAKRVSKLKSANRFFVAADVHPQTRTWCAPARKPSVSTSSSMTPTKCSITRMSSACCCSRWAPPAKSTITAN